jgi:putative colanic acid biosynthesis acetyltransferase WcaF
MIKPEVRQMKSRFKTHQQASAASSPWTVRQRIGMLAWEVCWVLFCRWTPKPLNGWRLWWLRRFGACIPGHAFVHQRARIQIPWNLTIRDKGCIGDAAVAYSLGEIEVGPGATVAQEAYLCTGTHDFSSPAMNLQTGKITIGANAFIGARAFVCPGLSVGDSAVVGACSVVTRDVPSGVVVTGNPARVIGRRSPPPSGRHD